MYIGGNPFSNYNEKSNFGMNFISYQFDKNICCMNVFFISYFLNMWQRCSKLKNERFKIILPLRNSQTGCNIIYFLCI